MKKQITLFVSALFATALFSQSFQLEWYNEYPEIATTAYGQTIILTQNDSIVMAGKVYYNSSAGSMFYLKADTDGNVARITYAESQYTNTSQNAFELIEDSDHNYVMVGNYSAYQEDTYFTKISPLGEVISTTINGGQYDYHEATDVEQTFDGGYLMTANNVTYDSGYVVGIRKANSIGQYDWSKSYYMGKFLGMAKISNTEFIVTGYHDYVPGSLEDFDMILVKININGDILWTKTYVEPDGNEFGNDIQVLPNNEGYIICGRAPDYNFPSFDDGVLQKVDVDGNIIWRETYTRTAMTNTNFTKVVQDGNGDFLVSARTQAGSSDISLLKYSQSGTLLQESHFDSGLNETAYGIALDSEGAIYLSANSGDNAAILKINDTCPVEIPEASLVDPTPVIGDDIIVAVENTNTEWEYSLIQLSGNVVLGTAMGNGSTYYFNAGPLTEEDVSEGLAVSVSEPTVGCTLYTDPLFVDFVTGINLNDETGFVVSPNPFRDYVAIQGTGNENTIAKLSVFDLNGRILVGENPVSKNQKINLSQLSKGIYILRITYKSGEKGFRKIVKE